MKKITNVIIILLLLSSLVIWEEVSIKQFFHDIFTRTMEIQSLSNDMDNINTAEILNKVENLEYSWHKKEHTICFLINQTQIEEMGVEIARLKATVAINQVEDFKASLSLILFYTQVYKHILGVSIQNIL